MYRLIPAALVLLAVTAASAQEIYRVVDENGNVTYTDQKPDDDARPMDLPQLNVLEGDRDELPIEPGEDAPGEGADLNFRIESPAAGETVSGDSVEIVMGIAIDVPPTAEIVLLLDGEALESIRTLTTSLGGLEPGEHRLFARLQTPSGRVIGTTEAIDFTVAGASADE